MKQLHQIWKLGCTWLVLLAMLTSLLPMQAMATQGGDEYSISNEYMQYTINSKTGGFCIETREGHPQKNFDNQIPLLYKEDRSRSNGTSFTTIRIDGKDYIFGQDYSWFGINSRLSTPVVSNEGRLITVTWSIKGCEITQKVALSMDENNDRAGNVGISYTVKNNTAAEVSAGVRLLLDNALDSTVDAPYVMAGVTLSPTIVETEFTGDGIPTQLRYVDSLSAPARMAYAIFDGWSGESNAKADRVIVGHWANLANTRYDYHADQGCDFSNYSNAHRIPDTATAFYWSEQALAPGAERQAELLYGVGNFSGELSQKHMGIDMAVGNVTLDSNGTEYVDGGRFKATVTLDNSVDGARKIHAGSQLILTAESGLSFVAASGPAQEYRVTYDNAIEVGDTKTLEVDVIADKQLQISARRVVASFNGKEMVDEAADRLVEYSTNRNVLLPGVGGVLPDIQMTQISPQTVYFEGEKNLSVSGDMEEFKALKGSDGWSLYLVSSVGGEETLIPKKNITFSGDSYETLSFSTDATMAVGAYKVVFRFTDAQLIKSFGASVTAAAQLNVSADPRDRCVSYGIVTMVRHHNQSTNRQLYDLVALSSEKELQDFTSGELSKNGLVTKDIELGDSDEVLMVIRGKLRQMTTDKNVPYFSASTEDGDITINNILTYTGTTPISLTADKSGASVSGDGTLQVINSINVWHNLWSFNASNGTKYTLDPDAVEEEDGVALEMSLDGAGSMLQNIAGFLIDIKYGVLTLSDELYGISFGGSITLPISGGKKAADESTPPDGGGTPGGTAPGTPGATPGTPEGEEDEEEGALSADIRSVLFGQRDDEKIGFVGIDTTLKVGLPENVLGPLVKNSVGIEAEVTINTINHYYAIGLGVDLGIVECEGKIALKQVPIRGIPTMLPDELSFKIGGDIVGIPIVPPFLTLTGLGGGVSNLADTFSDATVGELPPITILLSTSLSLVETLDGDFDMSLSLSGFSLEGDLKLSNDPTGKILSMQAGLSARWITPFFINAYGSMSVCDGLLTGGFNIKISDDYFYGYVFASLCIPQSVPLLGGMTLAGVEGAISSDFVGANLKVLGIKLGFIYYWEGDYDFGTGIDLSSRGGAVTIMPESYYNTQGELVSYTGAYGTNLRRLDVNIFPSARSGGGIRFVCDPTTQDALMLEVRLDGTTTPAASDIVLTTPSGQNLTMVPGDDQGNGNYLIQNRGAEGNYLYITITDPAQLVSGAWNLQVNTPDVTLGKLTVNGVDNLPELTDVSFAYTDGAKTVDVSWITDCTSNTTGTLDVYLTKDPDVFAKLEQATISDEDNALLSLERVELSELKSGSAKVMIPDCFAEGSYYVVAMLSQNEGSMSKAMSHNSFAFTNSALPAAPLSAAVSYGGNGALKATVVDPEGADYDTYLVTVLDEAGKPIPGGYGEYPAGAPVLLALNEPNSNISLFREGSSYSVQVGTRRTRDGLNYFSTHTVSSAPYQMPQTARPKLLSVVSNVPPAAQYVAQSQIELTYTFDQPVTLTVTKDGIGQPLPGGANTVWSTSLSLEDGAHLIDFTARNAAGDSITGGDSVDVPGAQLGFTVDTQAPVLSLGMDTAESLDRDKSDTAVSKQNVFVDPASGSISFVGIAEPECTLTLGGTGDGITIAPDGSFSVQRTVSTTKAYDRLLLRATDKAGNATELIISLINSDLAAFESLQLIAEAGEETDPDSGLRYVELSIGQSLKLNAFGVKGGAQRLPLSATELIWNVLYEQNIITLQDGVVTAVNPGETTIRASYRTASYEAFSTEPGTLDGGLSDIITVRVKDSGYRYKLAQTDRYTIFTLVSSKELGAVTVTVDDKPTLLLYDESQQAYVGVFSGRISSDTLLKGMASNSDAPRVPLLPGDTNNDGRITQADLNAAITIYLDGFAGRLTGDLNELIRADLNGDRKVDILDAQLLQKLLRGEAVKK